MGKDKEEEGEVLPLLFFLFTPPQVPQVLPHLLAAHIPPRRRVASSPILSVNPPHKMFT